MADVAIPWRTAHFFGRSGIASSAHCCFLAMTLFPHRARLLRRRALPAALQPCVRLRPARDVEEERAVERARDVQIADREIRPGEPLRLRERGLEHVERILH